MKILLVHNYYLQAGGEDIAFRAEYDLLRSHGHSVQIIEDHNTRIAEKDRLSLAVETVWSRPSKQRIDVLLNSFQPDVVHFQNTFPLISPSAYYACHAYGIPVVQTLQNYRLLCPAATFYRDGHVCVDCLGKKMPLPGILHACYRGSRSQTSVVAAMLFAHHAMGTWFKKVDAYIALTRFSRDQFLKAGFPAQKISIKPNMLASDPGQKPLGGTFAVFVGRLAKEKGIYTMLESWKTLDVPLKIIGDGPLREEVLRSSSSSGSSHIEYLGSVSHEEVILLMKKAAFLVFPSEWFEGFPLTIAEAFACGLPVIASRLGSMQEIIRDNETGLLFNTGESKDMADKVAWLWAHREAAHRIGKEARREYETKYTPEENYRILAGIYEKAMLAKRS